MESKKVISINIDIQALQKEYAAHQKRCSKIADEINKWGNRTSKKLGFLAPEKAEALPPKGSRW